MNIIYLNILRIIIIINPVNSPSNIAHENPVKIPEKESLLYPL